MQEIFITFASDLKTIRDEQKGARHNFFVSWCIEQYKVVKGLDGETAMLLLDRYGMLDYLANSYEVLHTQGRAWLMEEIDEVIEQRKKEGWK